jgi:hypothetical protein
MAMMRPDSRDRTDLLQKITATLQIPSFCLRFALNPLHNH